MSVSHEFALNVRWSGTLKELVILFDAMPYCLNRHFVVFLVNVSIVGTGPVSFVTKLNIGLIGAGVFAGYHASKAASSDYAVLNGVYDLDINAAEKLVEKIGQGEATTDLDMLIMSSDAVMIATPAVTHASLVGRALRAGRHVLVEKPLALTGIEARRSGRIGSSKRDGVAGGASGKICI